MTLAELGALLQEERIRKNITIEDVATQLRLSHNMVRALEAGDTKELPHAVYARGFARSYSLMLGFSHDETNEFLSLLQHETPAKIVSRDTPQPLHSHTGQYALGLLLKIALISLIALGGYLYYIYNIRDVEAPTAIWEQTNPVDNANKIIGESQPATPANSPPSGSEPDGGTTQGTEIEPDTSAAPPIPVESAAPSAQNPKPNANSTAAIGAPDGAAGNAANQAASPAATQTGQANNPNTQAHNPAQAAALALGLSTPAAPPPATHGTQSTAVVPPTQAPPAQAPDTLPALQVESQLNPAPPPGQHQVVLTALEDCWVYARADKAVTRELTLKKGETFAMPFKTALQLRLGNAGGVTIQYDGKQMPPAGRTGQVKEVTFPPTN